MDKADDYAAAKEIAGPKLTKDEIDAVVQASKRQYHTFPDSTVTVCLVTLPDGSPVVGMASCADPANFDPTTGQRMAIADAKAEMFALHGAADKPKAKRGPKKKFFEKSDKD